ncbi:MAG TPA: hypothetical protein VII24_11430 [Pseudolabrys sp.]|jgi:uncharacterized membrane protein
MNKHRISRIVSVLVGAAVLFGLEQGLGLKFYIAIPAGVLAYIVTLLALGLVLGTEPRAK